MSLTKKVLIIIFSVILVAALGFAITWCVINFDKVEDAMSGTGLYTEEDINNAYQDGYNSALKDRDEYDNLINEYRDTITRLTDSISQLNSEISSLNVTNNALELQISNLTLLKEDLEAQVEDLMSDKIINEATITDLNSQIIALNTQIDSLKLQVQNHNAVVSSLYKTIADLQASIEYYEQYIATLESGDSVVVTFIFDGKVYNIQVVSKGSIVSVTTPSSTEGVIFNGWTVDGQPVTLSEYPVYTNTKFVADVSYKYIVNFTVDGVIKSTQLVDKGSFVIEPSKPKKSGYTFKCWTLDGNLEVDLTTFAINSDTTFIAKFAKLYTVIFQYEDGREIVSRRIEEGTTTTEPRISDLADGFVLAGWTVNGNLVDVSKYTINEDIVFIAKIVKAEFDSLSEMTWNGSIGVLGSEIWTDGVDIYYSNRSFTEQIHYVLDVDTQTWSEMTWYGLDKVPYFYGSCVWSDGVNYYYSSNTYQYVLDVATHTWSEMKWNGLSSLYWSNIWTDGVNYYHTGRDGTYVLFVETHTWVEITCNSPSSEIFGNYIWSDGLNYYYSRGSEQYILNVSNQTHTWTKITWNGLSSFDGDKIWSDGTHFYYSNGDQQYVLDVESQTWVKKIWNGVSSFTGDSVWTDGLYYYSGFKYVFGYSK